MKASKRLVMAITAESEQQSSRSPIGVFSKNKGHHYRCTEPKMKDPAQDHSHKDRSETKLPLVAQSGTVLFGNKSCELQILSPALKI